MTMAGLNLRAAILSVLLLILFLGAWQLATGTLGGPGDALAEEEDVIGLLATAWGGMPAPTQVFQHAWNELSRAFHDGGPNDKGIGLHLMYSVGRVLAGFALAALVAVPLGFLIGLSPVLNKALNPYIQVFMPISPLAWLPLALFTIKDTAASVVFVIFICSLWPMLFYSAQGVASGKRDWLNLARTLELSSLRTAIFVILPAAAPTILTGVRISVGISWLVIVAAEMLVGSTGIGHYVWTAWGTLDISAVIFAILMIGIVGMLLDATLHQVGHFLRYQE